MIHFVTNVDTDLLLLRVISETAAISARRISSPAELDEIQLDRGVADSVILHLLGGGLPAGEVLARLRNRCAEARIELWCFNGEPELDPELTATSTAPPGLVQRAFSYLVAGGEHNLRRLLEFVETYRLEPARVDGIAPPVALPAHGLMERSGPASADGRPRVAIAFYRSHLLSGNNGFIEDLCIALEEAGAVALPFFCQSLRPSADGTVAALGELKPDCLITTVLAAGSSGPNGWEADELAGLDVPILQAIPSTSSRSAWADSPAGLNPLDVAMNVALPELDGRIISVPVAFKEVLDDSDTLGAPVTVYRSAPDRLARIARLSVALARLRHKPAQDRRIAIILSAYPTKRSRLGNAVGLDTPASAITLLHSLAAAGYRVTSIPDSPDELMALLADGLTYDQSVLSPAQIEAALARSTPAEYQASLTELGPSGLEHLLTHWGPAPGDVHLDGSGKLCFSGLDLGNVIVAIQPPRGFSDDPIATYHSPDLAPTHHYLAFYRWLELGFRADALVHLGKHGTLEWLPGKSTGLSSDCFTDFALGNLPLVYPFVVNDPGEGSQAKRRGRAIIIDHLVPPLTRADTYGDLLRIERLLDTHAEVAAMDPAKLPAVRAELWDALVEAEIHRDLHLDDPPADFGSDDFDDLVLHVDGYLCELKDAQIRGGLHILGQPPSGPDQIDMILALTRSPQGEMPSLRDALGLSDNPSRNELDEVEGKARQLVELCQRLGFDRAAVLDQLGTSVSAAVRSVLGYICEDLVPRLDGTTDEITNLTRALDGRFVPPGPSGAPSRGMAHVLPTGRNFYSIDPRAIPSRFAYQVGWKLADQLVARHLEDTGSYPRSVAMVLWGTAAMRTAGDDVAEALALLGVRPVWSATNGRVTGLEVLPLDRPRIDVTLRISGFFRDAFPHVIALLDEAIELVGNLDEPPEDNMVARHGLADPRIFGPQPGAYGSGILNAIDSGNWESRADLAQIYVTWSGYSYGRAAMGVSAPEALVRRLQIADVALKNQDNREHDIFDSDDYLQDHGGMIAAIAHLTGRSPAAYFGDSADPSRPRVRSLVEEAVRVVRSRVVNPKWISAMMKHGYKGAFEMAATTDYLFGYDATADILEDWVYERVTEAYVGDPEVVKFFGQSNPWALKAIAARLMEAVERGMWDPSDRALEILRNGILAAEGFEEDR
jgi:cobaltochelatase CobN